MSRAEPTLPEELLLLALDPARGKTFCRGRYLEYGMAGAALAELELQGQISESLGKVLVVNPLVPGDPVLAQVLALLPEPGKGTFAGTASARSWIHRNGSQIEGLYLDRLVEQGVLLRETRRFAGLLPYHRHPAGPHNWSAQARAHFAAAETADFPDHRSRALAALVAATGLAQVTAQEGWRSRAAMRGLIRSEWPANAVRRNVQRDRSRRSGA
ncbi:GPP34 family phosphoprotein [Streptomyces sp. NBC_01267]|uniref:GOLPH3/VPS74 family protein n=1 Tax=unclassified Streptomyces TaxID=2593676 RepID=UPI0020248DB6|nr:MULTISPECIES: GPP34 family phosphoprotein [unclassified Streptomyces]MCX4548957.1 GPP34 family phosphoprotein [Streptomyces sp. NBC_01500]WSC20534.1 GPP34 family phosphoprotein [Streptomyces sp. NBC_01766]WSV54567.1 GPP34 family phosphoprotein [Streptomyces sp. NBC_01014]